MNARRTFVGGATLLFAVSAAITIGWCGSMSSMGGMPMPGGWTMSMAWMRMPGQSWPGAAATFLGMWSVMMLAMMLPAVTPVLAGCRQHLRDAGAARANTATLLAATGYFFVWTVVGFIAFALGVALTELEMRSPAIARAAPIAAGVATLLAGALQFTRWKARQLACCRHYLSVGSQPRDRARAAAAVYAGLRLGLRCSYCCAGLTVVLLATGVMDLRAMAAVTVAITIERLAPTGSPAARAIGLVFVVAGLAALNSAV